jgi:hypothetical protein
MIEKTVNAIEILLMFSAMCASLADEAAVIVPKVRNEAVIPPNTKHKLAKT